MQDVPSTEMSAAERGTGSLRHPSGMMNSSARDMPLPSDPLEAQLLEALPPLHQRIRP